MQQTFKLLHLRRPFKREMKYASGILYEMPNDSCNMYGRSYVLSMGGAMY